MIKRKFLFIICVLILSGLLLVFINDNSKTPAQEKINTESAEEERIKELLETLDGVSDVSVLLTFESEPSIKASTLDNNADNDTTSKEIKGIAISANGGDDPLISEKIKSLLCAAYNIPDRAIFVCGK